MLTAIHQILDIELAIMLESYRDDLLAKNRTAERFATIGQFAAGIGHELRNPLGIVESSAFLVTQRLEHLKVADPGIKRHMEKIVAEVQRSGRTITDLLELARNRPPKRRVVDAREFVLETVPAAHLPPAVTVTVNVPAGVPLDADPDQLGRVLINLLINAGQAMNGAGTSGSIPAASPPAPFCACGTPVRACRHRSASRSSRRSSRPRRRVVASGWRYAGGSPKPTAEPSK